MAKELGIFLLLAPVNGMSERVRLKDERWQFPWRQSSGMNDFPRFVTVVIGVPIVETRPLFAKDIRSRINCRRQLPFSAGDHADMKYKCFLHVSFPLSTICGAHGVCGNA